MVANIATTVVSFVAGLFGGGDAVPNYPIRSGNTFKKIVAEISGTFKEPADFDAAMWYIKEAERWIADAVRKKTSGEASAAVMDTYIMMLQDFITIYEDYIANDVWTAWNPNPGSSSGGGGVNINLPGGSGGSGNNNLPPPQPKQAGMSTTTMIIVAAIGLGLLSSKKRR
jgi:hypothetical protein